MPRLVCTTATLRCSMGTTPSAFVGSCAQVRVSGRIAGTIMDHVPCANVNPFGLCRSLANPMVAAATAAALGTLTPQPCMPVLPAPWTPGATRTTLQRKKALTEQDTLACAWAGRIEVVQPGQQRVNVK